METLTADNAKLRSLAEEMFEIVSEYGFDDYVPHGLAGAKANAIEAKRLQLMVIYNALSPTIRLSRELEKASAYKDIAVIYKKGKMEMYAMTFFYPYRAAMYLKHRRKAENYKGGSTDFSKLD